MEDIKLLNRKFMIIAIFLVSLLAISAVGAVDVNSMDNENQDLAIDGGITQDICADEDSSDDLTYSPATTWKVNGTTFNDIQNTIGGAVSGDTISLSGTYTGKGDEIIIDKALTIVGDGKTTLNAKSSSGIFKMTATGVVIKNINFINSKWDFAISGYIWDDETDERVNCGQIVNCTFNNNLDGAFEGGTAINCTFINNKGNSISGEDLTIINCTFINNAAKYGGGAILSDNANLRVHNCKFINNSASNGGAIYICVYNQPNQNVIVSDSYFENNVAEDGSNFIFLFPFESYSEAYGKSINISNCNFKNNDPRYYGGIKVVENTLYINSTTSPVKVKISGKTYVADVIKSSLELSDSLLRMEEPTTDTIQTSVELTGLDSGIYYATIQLTCFDDASKINEVTLPLYIGVKSQNANNDPNNGSDVSGNVSGGEQGNANTSNNELNPSVDDGTFTALQNKIDSADSGSIIILEKDYIYDVGFNNRGIIINKTLTINGNGATLDAKEVSHAFLITANNVVLNNINFVNCYDGQKYSSISGSAINWKGTQGSLVNCTFTNCREKYNCGGAVYWNGAYGSIVKCTFYNCEVYTSDDEYSAKGGAVYLNSSYGSFEGCIFVNCNAINDYKNLYYYARGVSSYGGALYVDSGADHVSVKKCSFVNSSVGASAYSQDSRGWSADTSSYSYGGAIYWDGAYGSLEDSSFVNSYANASSISGYSTSSCHSKAYSYGGAVYWNCDGGSLVNCSFVNSNVESRAVAGYGGGSFSSSTYGYGGAVYLKGSSELVSNCSFVNSNIDVKSGYANQGTHWEVSGTSSTYPIYGFGGAVYCEGVDGNFSSCSFVNNSATSYGGAVYIPNSGSGSFVKCTFMNNYARKTQNDISGNATAKDCSFNDCDLIVGDIDKFYGDDKKFVATLVNGDRIPIADANVIITVNNKKSTVKTDSMGRATVDLSLPIGSYDVVSEYNSISIRSKVTVKSTLTTTDAFGTYSNSKVMATFLNIDGTALANLKVTFNVGGNDYVATTDSNGVATANVELSAGTYDVTAINPINNEQKQFKLTINKANSAISLISNQNNGVATLIATLTPASASGDVIFSVNDKTFSEAIKNGVATLKLSDLNGGNYVVTASYNGDSNLNASISNTVTFKVDDVYPVLTANPVTKTYGTSTKLVVYLKDNKGNAIANEYVKVVIGSTVNDIKTDSNGQATLAISNAPGSYTANITYATAQTTAKITVKKATPKITASKKTYKVNLKTKKYIITLKANGKAMKSTKVYIKVNKKTFTATTNSKGQATFKITNLNKKGTFSATVTYKATKCYNKATKTVKITTKK